MFFKIPCNSPKHHWNYCKSYNNATFKINIVKNCIHTYHQEGKKYSELKILKQYYFQ